MMMMMMMMMMISLITEPLAFSKCINDSCSIHYTPGFRQIMLKAEYLPIN